MYIFQDVPVGSLPSGSKFIIKDKFSYHGEELCEKVGNIFVLLSVYHTSTKFFQVCFSQKLVLPLNSL